LSIVRASSQHAHTMPFETQAITPTVLWAGGSRLAAQAPQFITSKRLRWNFLLSLSMRCTSPG
jgi:hypothetical protein